MSLVNGTNDGRVLRAELKLAPFDEVGCPKTFEQLRQWVQQAEVVFSLNAPFGYTSGTRQNANPDSRALPRFMFDEQGRYLGLQAFVPSLGRWTTGAYIGELKTIYRTASTLALDMENKGLAGAGWIICDGKDNRVPDLTVDLQGTDQNLVDPDNHVNDSVKSKSKVKSPWFRGTAPDWDIYTVCYIGVSNL